MPVLPPNARATLPAQAGGAMRPAMPAQARGAMRPPMPTQARGVPPVAGPGMKKGGAVDGIAQKGKTKGKVIGMKRGGKC